MIEINGKHIDVTRGNILPLIIDALNEDKTKYEFKIGDVLRFTVMEAKNVDNILLQKDFKVTEVSTEQEITLTAEEMKIGELVNKPIKYWYEVELNPDTYYTQTIIGYTKEEGPAILTILPEGGDKK